MAKIGTWTTDTVLGAVSLVTSQGDTVDGDYTTPAHTAVNALATTTVALAANTARNYAAFINNSDEVIYLGLGTAAVLNIGIRLNASGGSFEMSRQIGNLYTGAVNCISTSGTKILCVTEGV